jgi:hypothetical protein
MNLELLEHFLVNLDGQNIILVQPFFGRVSDSYYGSLHATTSKEHHVLFNFNSTSVSKIFEANDVLRIDPPVQGTKESIIRMKGPNDYKEHWQSTVH